MGCRAGRGVPNSDPFLTVFPIIDAHAHLWLRQDAEVEGRKIRTLGGGRSEFMGEIRQMLPPCLIDGRNTAEVFLSNMDYAQVSAAVVTQEYIDGDQNDYLLEVQKQYPDRFLCCGLVEVRRPGCLAQAEELIGRGFRAIKVPAQRLVTAAGKIPLTGDEPMAMFRRMEQHRAILSIDLADGAEQVAEMEEIIAECPRLKIAIGHFGMVTRPGWREQIRLARHENVRIESGGITWLFNDEFYPFAGAVRAIREAAELVGIEKLMWGSDYPRTTVAVTYRMTCDFVGRSALLSPEEKSLFLGRNAERFYGFENPVELPYIKNMSE
jgi:predicted TIM-barrel fold metal-dependent hydrolase